MRIFAVDHGNARCGCAVSDPTETIARPIETIEPTEAAAVAGLVRESEAELVVVGLPLRLSGEEGPQAVIARSFRDELASLVDVPVDTYDERLTTRMAERTAQSDPSGSQDSVAAAHLLEGYMQHRAHSGADGGEDL